MVQSQRRLKHDDIIDAEYAVSYTFSQRKKESYT